jgi:hypothetical protein
LLYWQPVLVACVAAACVVLGSFAWAVGHPAKRSQQPAEAADSARPESAKRPAVEAPLTPGVRPAPVLPVASAPEPPPAAPERPAAEESAATCAGESYGTSVKFLNSPAEAARQARTAGKLLFVLHVSGNFEDSRFT